MLLPNYFLILLVTLPILIESIPQQLQSRSELQECSEDSNCRKGSFCNLDRCVACQKAGCGIWSICGNTAAGNLGCECPVNTQGDPKVKCHFITECSNNSQCRAGTYCSYERCSACNIGGCGPGSNCRENQAGKFECFCPDKTQGDPKVQCLPVTANVVGDRQGGVNQIDNLGSSSQGQQIVTDPGANQGKPKGTDDIEFPGENSGQGERNPRCLNTPNPGECRAAFKRFYYNKGTDQCDCFLFGGCDEEEVAKDSWVTLEECQRICLPGIKSQGPGCKRASLEEVTSFLEEERRIRENNSN